MLLRKLLLTAALMAPLVSVPVAASAQATGRAQAVLVTANSHAESGMSHGKATGRSSDLPAGIANGAGGATLPPGISWTRPQVVTESDPPPDEQPPAEECTTGTVFTIQNGVYGVLDTCTGVFTPL
jgi:hypothetical protein